jgi:hypothetical protein
MKVLLVLVACIAVSLASYVGKGCYVPSSVPVRIESCSW